MNNLGVLLAYQVNPLDLYTAPTRWEKAAAAGKTLARSNLEKVFAPNLSGVVAETAAPKTQDLTPRVSAHVRIPQFVQAFRSSWTRSRPGP